MPVCLRLSSARHRIASYPPRRHSLHRCAVSMAASSGVGGAGGLVGMRHAPAADRNKDAIASVLARIFEPLPVNGIVVEVASGTGQHVSHFAAMPFGARLVWAPTEKGTGEAMENNLMQNKYASKDEALATIDAYVAHAGVTTNVKAARLLDVSEVPWNDFENESAAGVFCANLTHISPWCATEGLITGASLALMPGGRLAIYGPFAVDGVITPESNARFDASLRQQNSEFGYRDTRTIIQLAKENGLQHSETVEMPANNHMLVFQKE